MRANKTICLLATILLIVCGCCLSSCSDSDDTTSIIVNNGDKEACINRLGGNIDIPIESNGTWKASLDDVQGKLKWVGIKGAAEGKGSGSISLSVDYLNPKKQIQERTANLVLECDGKKEIVKLRQYIGLKEGESAENDNTQPFTDLWFNKGVGSGYNILTGEQTETIFNVEELKKYLAQNQTAKDQIKVALSDTLDEDTASLKVDCKLSVKYGTFKLNLNVNYDNKGYQLSNVKTYNSEQSVTFLSSNFRGMSTLRHNLEKKVSGLEDQVEVGFLDVYDLIVDSYKTGNKEEFKENVEYLYETIGPVVITGADLGGSIFFSMRYDSLAMEENFKVHGDLDAKLMLAGVTIQGGVAVDYVKKGMQIWNASQHFITASGGNSATLASLTKLMTEKEPNLNSIQAAADKWINSITSASDQTDNTSLINIRYQGIWNLFPFKMSKEMKEIAREYYKDKKTCINLASIGIAPEQTN
mgnify:FL=1